MNDDERTKPAAAARDISKSQLLQQLRKTNAFVQRKVLTVGSDCSGVGTDKIALSRLNLDFVTKFASVPAFPTTFSRLLL